MKSLILVPFSIFMVFKKGTLWMAFSPQTRPNCTGESYRTRPCRDPAFHEIIVITVKLGPSVFLNVIFPMEIGELSVCSAFLCAMFYIPFFTYHVLHQTLLPLLHSSSNREFHNYAAARRESGCSATGSKDI